jgi:Ca2+-binding RTX toxin-like protein
LQPWLSRDSGGGVALADDCLGFVADCDAGYSTDLCTVQYIGGVGYLTCDLNANGGTSNTVTNAVFDGSSYLFWGTEANGASFCCDMGTYNVDLVIDIDGTQAQDTVNLHDGGANQLDHPGFGNYVTAHVRGYDDVDTIEGSSSNSAYYTEVLEGGDGGDLIRGFAGSDVLIGGDGVDTLYGGDDHDTLCGGAGLDTLRGDDGVDYLWGEEAATMTNISNLFGDAGNDYCQTGGGRTSCEYILSPAPTACP